MDIDKNRDRFFIVWVENDEEEVTVEAGEDADEICGEILETMLANIDSGWQEQK